MEWLSAQDPTKGFKYLYLSPADYASLTERSPSGVVLKATRIVEGGEERFVLTGGMAWMVLWIVSMILCTWIRLMCCATWHLAKRVKLNLTSITWQAHSVILHVCICGLELCGYTAWVVIFLRCYLATLASYQANRIFPFRIPSPCQHVQMTYCVLSNTCRCGRAGGWPGCGVPERQWHHSRHLLASISRVVHHHTCQRAHRGYWCLSSAPGPQVRQSVA